MQILTILSIIGITIVILFFSYTNSKPPANLSPTLPTQPQTFQPTSAVLNQQTQATAAPTQQTPMARQASITTSKGVIVLELYPDVAPNTVRNFQTKAESGFYNGLTFHRIETWVAQGGDPNGDGTGGGDMPTEFNDKPFKAGSLGVARRNDPTIQNDSQFFITKTDADWLNNQYTNFGEVTSGMDVVNKLQVGDKIVKITVE